MGQTITVAQDREFSTDSTVVPREVARGVYIERAPTAQGLKLLLLLIGTAGGRMGDDVQHELRLADLKAISGIKNHSRETMRALFVELRGAVMVYEDAVTKDEIIGGFVDEMRVTGQHGDSGDLYVRWWFGRTFRRIAAESNHWAIIDRQTAFALRSKFAILLFQHVSSLVNLNHVTSKVFSIDELRAILGVDVNKLTRWSDLRRFALDPAISEISQLSRFALTYTLQKTGRNVVRVVVAWEVKDDLRDTRRELDHSKVGRKVRREGRGKRLCQVPVTCRRFRLVAASPIRRNGPRCSSQHGLNLGARTATFPIVRTSPIMFDVWRKIRAYRRMIAACRSFCATS